MSIEEVIRLRVYNILTRAFARYRPDNERDAVECWRMVIINLGDYLDEHDLEIEDLDGEYLVLYRIVKESVPTYGRK